MDQRTKTMEFLEENLCDLGLVNDFFKNNPQATKINWTSILKCESKNTVKKVKKWENYLEIRRLKRDIQNI